MRLSAIFEGEEQEIDVRDEGEGRYTVALGERRFQVDAQLMEGNTWSLLIDGRSYEVDVDVAPDDTLFVRVDGDEFPMEVLDERRLRMRQASGAFEVEGRIAVRSPMPGKVVRVLVAEGQAVEHHQGLVVIEAMKMENELRAPKAGTVAELKVVEGQTVEANAVLLALE